MKKLILAAFAAAALASGPAGAADYVYAPQPAPMPQTCIGQVNAQNSASPFPLLTAPLYAGHALLCRVFHPNESGY